MTIDFPNSTSPKPILLNNMEPYLPSSNLNPLLVQPKATLATRAKTFIGSRLVGTTTATVALSLALVGGSAWNIWNTYNGFKTTVFTQFRLQDLSGKIVHLDEVLTMSARMAAATGDRKWEERYNSFAQELDDAIKEVTKTVPESDKANSAATDAANVKLVDLETRSFDLVRKGQQKDAFQLLLGPEYDAQKQIYAKGIQGVIGSVRTEIDTQLQSYSQRLFASVIFACVSLLLLLVCWMAILFLIRAYIRDNTRARQSLLDSQTVLSKLNEELGQQSQQVLAQEQITKQESEILQADIEQILDVVSAVEDGDLTVEADVSDRATGLVSDTLNRLIEELAKIMAVVLSTSRQIDRSANDLKQVAVAAAQQVELQTRSVNQVQTLMTNVNEISQNTAEQAIASDAAVQQAQVAVSQGQKEMQAMTKGIVALQAGTEQIVKRTQTLSEFVSSATQFTNDQKRVAALTRVLALNASMIAARASAQQDPEQFASVAREFETIANQVNELAVQTNQSLSLLQQRTDRIQTVVSGVDQDVQEITSLVDSFTLGVDRSRQVLDNIKAVTAQVAEVGQQVTQSSQAIATAAQTTLGTIYDIAAVANEAEQQSRVTRDKAEGMDRLARTLLDKVQFFRLPSDLEPETDAKQLTASVGNGANADDTVPDLSAVRSPIAIR